MRLQPEPPDLATIQSGVHSSSNYTDIVEGSNRITAKLSCPESTKWYSVNAIGVQTGQANTNISSSNFTPSVLGAINETGTLTPQPEAASDLDSTTLIWS